MGDMAEPDSAVVLVADGEASVLREISSTLTKAGFKVLPALGESAFVELCTRHREAVQLAIVDISMANHIDRLYEIFPQIRVLFTGNRDESHQVRQIGRSGQIREFLKKPFRRSQLLGRVLQVLDTPMAYTA